jgi:hypothetical protein
VAYSPITAAADPVGQADFATKMATMTTRDQTQVDASKAYGQALVTYLAALGDAVKQCCRCHPQVTGQGALEAAQDAYAVAAAALVTATTT